MMTISFALASIDRRSKDIRVFPMVVAELEFRDVQRHIFLAHLVECADYTALDDRPEAYRMLRKMSLSRPGRRQIMQEPDTSW